jgi:hypothetical protein
MSLTSKQWYDLAWRLGDVSKCIIRMMSTIQNKYGRSDIMSRSLLTLKRRYLCNLENDLSSKIHQAYPATHYLPGYENLYVGTIFFNINHYSYEETKSLTKNVRPLPKCLTSEEVLIFKQSINFIKSYVNDVDAFFFKKWNKSIAKFREILGKFDDFLQTVTIDETKAEDVADEHSEVESELEDIDDESSEEETNLDDVEEPKTATKPSVVETDIVNKPKIVIIKRDKSSKN